MQCVDIIKWGSGSERVPSVLALAVGLLASFQVFLRVFVNILHNSIYIHALEASEKVLFGF